MKIILLAALLLSLPLAAGAEAVPSRAKRMKALEDANLTQETAGMDELDQDLFYLRAKRGSAADLQKKYPRIRPDKLLNLQSVVKEQK